MPRDKPPQFSTADIHDEQPDLVTVINRQFRVFGQHTCFSGPIETLRVFSDHSAVRDTVAGEGRGRVLVIDAGEDLSVGVLGDRIAALAVEHGWAGFVVFGAVRDSEALDGLPIGVRALGTTARRSSIVRAGERGTPLRVGDVRIQPGDWLYADRDAVLIGPTQLDVPTDD